MAPVFTQMRGNSVRTCGYCDFSCAPRMGMQSTARVADGGHMVDVYTKP
jgi:hypothetical protein